MDGIQNGQWKWIEEIWPEQDYGWNDGVYKPRKAKHAFVGQDSQYVCVREDGIEVKSRVFTETEETGFGIYCYENTAGLQIPCKTVNARVTVVFVNPTACKYEAYILSLIHI